MTSAGDGSLGRSGRISHTGDGSSTATSTATLNSGVPVGPGTDRPGGESAGTPNDPIAAPEFIVPTFIVLAGFEHYEPDAEAIRIGVLKRLDSSFPAEALCWTNIYGDSATIERRIEHDAAPLLTQDLWNRLVLDDFVEPGRTLVRVIVMYNLNDDTKVAEASRVLSDVQHGLSKVFTGGIEVRNILMLLGESIDAVALDDAAVSPFLLRLQMGTKAQGGLNVLYTQVVECCQTMVVAMLGSQIEEQLSAQMAATYSNTASPRWIAVGSAALTVDIPQMRRYLKLLIFRNLVQPLIWPNAEDVEGELAEIKTWIIDFISGFRRSVVDEVLAAIPTNAWRSEKDRSASDGTPTRLNSFEPSERLLQILDGPAEGLADALAKEYQIDRDVLANVPEKGLANYQDYLLEASCKAVAASPDLLAYKATLPGVHALTTVALQALMDNIDSSLLLGDRRILALPLIGDHLLAAAARWDAAFINANARRVNRFSQAIMSPLGTALQVAPALPLLTGIITSMSGWETVVSTLISALVLGVAATGERLGWLEELKHFRKKRNKENRDRVADTCIRLVARHVMDVQVRFADVLRRTQFAVERLQGVLRQRDNWAKEEIFSIWGTRPHMGSVFWLSDIPRCLEWMEQALERAVFDNVRRHLICDFVAPYLRQSHSASRVLRNIDAITDELADHTFHAEFLYPEMLVKQEQYRTVLDEGRWWRWLDEKANPLGRVSTRPTTSTFVVASGGALVGWAACGYWQPNWRVLTPRERREVVIVKAAY